MVQRILSRAAQSAVKRADDNEATIKNRIHTFRTNTEAILCQYGDKVKRVSGAHLLSRPGGPRLFLDIT